MLEPRHIVKLCLSAHTLAQYRELPKPRYGGKPLTVDFAAVSNAVLTELLKLPPEIFAGQLSRSRRRGVEYVAREEDGALSGVSVQTSNIPKVNDIFNKSLIVPHSMLLFDPALRDHYIISAFVSGNTSGGQLTNVDDVTVAGWVSGVDLQKWQAQQPPPTFKSKLDVFMVPCRQLRPMDELWPKLDLRRTIKL